MTTIFQPASRAYKAPAAVPHWRTVVWGNPVNLMSCVSTVLRQYFDYSNARAEEFVMAVHTCGRATIPTGMRERIKAGVMAMHSHGLRTTIEEDRD